MLDKSYQPSAIEGPTYRLWEDAGAFAAGQPGRDERASLRHRHPAAERDRLAAYGSRAQQHAAGRARPLRAHARPRRAVAAWDGSRRHRHADGGRAAIDGAPGAEPPRPRPRGVRRARLAVEGRVRRADHQSAEAARRLLRLVARALHHGRGAVARRAQGVRRSLPRRAHLQGQAPGQLGPEAAHRHLRPRSRAGRGEGPPLASALSARRPRLRSRRCIDLHRRRHHAARDHARRHRRRRASRRRALQGISSAST